MAVETDSYGQVIVPHHDGELLGVSVLGGDCQLRYRSTDGVERVIRLKEVHSLDVSNFREGNTILSLMVIHAGDALSKIPKELLLRLGWGQPPRLKGRVVFVLDSSYGADVVADCQDVEIVVSSSE